MVSSPDSNEQAEKKYKYIRIALTDEQHEQLSLFPGSWEEILRSEGGGNTYEGKRLSSLVKFAFVFLKRLRSLNVSLPHRDNFHRFFNGMQITVDGVLDSTEFGDEPVSVSEHQINEILSSNENFKLGSKLVEVANELGLPELTSDNARVWLSTLANAKNADINFALPLDKASGVDKTKSDAKSAKSDADKRRLTFGFVKTSFERVAGLIPDWGKTPTGVLQNLVAFAIEIIDYVRDRHSKKLVPGNAQVQIAELFDYYHQLGEEFILTAYAMNLPEPCVGNVPAWIMGTAYASLQRKSLDPTLPQSNLKHLLDQLIAGDALLKHCLRHSIATNLQPDKVDAWLDDIMSEVGHVTSGKSQLSNEQYAAIGKELVKRCKLDGIVLPDVGNMPEWFDKNIKNPNQSDCHDLLEMLFSMKLLPDEESMAFLASRFRVMTRQLYKAYYLMYPDGDDAVLHGSTGNNENVNDADG